MTDTPATWQECVFCEDTKLSMQTVTTRYGDEDCYFQCDLCGQRGPASSHVDIERLPNLASLQYDSIDPIFIALAAWNQTQRSLAFSFLERDFARDADNV